MAAPGLLKLNPYVSTKGWAGQSGGGGCHFPELVRFKLTFVGNDWCGQNRRQLVLSKRRECGSSVVVPIQFIDLGARFGEPDQSNCLVILSWSLVTRAPNTEIGADRG